MGKYLFMATIAYLIWKMNNGDAALQGLASPESDAIDRQTDVIEAGYGGLG